MPIDYKEYHAKWKLISWLIRVRRAGNKCEECFIRNGTIVKRLSKGNYRDLCGTEYDMIKSKVRYSGYSYSGAIKALGFTRIILTVAHLDHDKTNNRFWNLKALCQRCHLKHDINQHVANRKYGRNWKGKQQLKMNL